MLIGDLFVYYLCNMNYPKRPKDANQLGKYIVDLATNPDSIPVVLEDTGKKKKSSRTKKDKAK